MSRCDPGRALRADMILTIDIGNTHTDVGLGTQKRVWRTLHFDTAEWNDGRAMRRIRAWLNGRSLRIATVASVVPGLNRTVKSALVKTLKVPVTFLSHSNVVSLGVDYPKPETIGADRLANSVAAVHHYGFPVVVVDFGTAVTFDVVNGRGDYVGGIIAPGLGAMTDYLHEKTALLPRLSLRNPRRAIGKSTEEAMLIGTVSGYRGLIASLIKDLKQELRVRRLAVIATGGYADIMARDLSAVTEVDRRLTLEGLRLLAMDCLCLD